VSCNYFAVLQQPPALRHFLREKVVAHLEATVPAGEPVTPEQIESALGQVLARLEVVAPATDARG